MPPLGPAGEPGGPLRLPALTHRGRLRTRATQTVRGVDGGVLAELSLSPDLLVAQALQAQRGTPALPAAQRAALLTEASRHFLGDVLGGLSFAEHSALVSRVSGHNPQLTEELGRAVAQGLAHATERAERARPAGSLGTWREVGPRSGSGVWTRRARTLGAVLSGNLPTIQNGWLQALALGYRVAVRPSAREPFTAYRVIEALRAAGFRDTDAVYLPATHAGGRTLLRRAELGLVYGGDDIKARYAGSATVKVGGPGRSKTLVGHGHDTARAVAAVAESVTAFSGAACVNTTAVLVEGDHAGFAARLAALLAARAEERRGTARYLGPRVPQEVAAALLERLRGRAARARAEIPLDRVAVPHPEGGVVLGPAVFTVDDPHDDVLGAELPFPCVWVAPWSRADGVAPLRGSLVVNAITGDDDLITALLDEPEIQNVYRDVPTVHSDGRLPHEGFIGDFLMRNKAVVAA